MGEEALRRENTENSLWAMGEWTTREMHHSCHRVLSATYGEYYGVQSETSQQGGVFLQTCSAIWAQ